MELPPPQKANGWTSRWIPGRTKMPSGEHLDGIAPPPSPGVHEDANRWAGRPAGQEANGHPLEIAHGRGYRTLRTLRVQTAGLSHSLELSNDHPLERCTLEQFTTDSLELSHDPCRVDPDSPQSVCIFGVRRCHKMGIWMDRVDHRAPKCQQMGIQMDCEAPRIQRKGI